MNFILHFLCVSLLLAPLISGLCFHQYGGIGEYHWKCSDTIACRFRGERTGEKLIRLSEATPIGTEAFRVLAFPRRNFNIQAIDGSRELGGYFSFRELDRSRVSIVLEKSLQDLVDQSAPTSSIQFRLACRGIDGDTDYLPVTVFVEDINDNKPEFLGAPYRIRVEELTPPGLTIFRGLQALDRDKPNTANSEVTYSIIEGNEQRKFSVEATSSKKAVVVLRKELDYDSGDKLFNLTIKAEDNGAPPLASETFLVIDIRDGDDLNPTFTEALYSTQIQEDYPITGNPVEKQLNFNPPILAYDQDLGINASLQYSILSGNDLGIFSIDPATGNLFATKEIDREALDQDEFELEIEAQQRDNPLKAATTKIQIKIQDINDNRPQFEETEVTKTILEHLGDGEEVMQFKAVDLDQGENAKFLYSLNDPSGAFEINPHSGSLTIKNGEKFDREKFQNGYIDLVIGALEFRPSVLEIGEQKSRSVVKVRINVKDDNDNSPTFVPTNTYSFNVDVQELALGSVVGQVTAKDVDLGINGIVRYRIRTTDTRADPPYDYFGIDAATGHIRIKKLPLTKRKYILYVYAIDQAEIVDKRRSSMAIVQIKIDGILSDQIPDDDEEDIEIVKAVTERIAATPSEQKIRVLPKPQQESPKEQALVNPKFPPGVQKFVVASDAIPGTPIGRPAVTGLSPNGSASTWTINHRYRHGVPFDISPHSGLISLVKPVGKHALDAYTVKVTVNSEGKTDSTRVRIIIEDKSEKDKDDEDITDKEKQVEQLREEFERKDFKFKVAENAPGVLVANLTLLEFQSRGDPTFIEYIITSLDAKDKFTITDNGLLYTKVGLDREEQDEYDITIAMGRRGVIRGKEVLEVTVQVTDVNDNSPSFDKHIYQGSIMENAEPGTSVALDNPIGISDPDLDDEAQLQLLGKGSTLFKLDNQDIVLRSIGNSTKNVMGLSDQEKKIYLRLRATDKAGHITESQLVVHILSNQTRTNEEIVVRGLSIIDGQFVQLIDNGGKGDLLVKETTPIGTRIAQLVITDQASQKLESGLTFQILEEKSDIQPNLFRLPKRQIDTNAKKDEKHFDIDAKSGYLSLLRKLSVRHKYMLKVQVTDQTGLTAETSIHATVEDVNDHAPVFAKTSYEFRISEGNYDKVKIGEVLATDGDLDANAEIRFDIVTDDDKAGLVTINEKEGSVVVNGILDRESYTQLQFKILAKDLDHVTAVNATLIIMDVNDNAPTFFGYTRLRKKDDEQKDILNNIVPIYTVEIEANLPPESEFFRVFANDTDIGLNGLVTFELLNHRDMFRIDAFTGSLYSLKRLNFDLQNLYDLSIVASDRGRPSLRSMAAIIVTIKQAKVEVVQLEEEEEKVVELVGSTVIPAKGKLFTDPEVVIEILENIRVPANILDLKGVLNKDNTGQGEISFEIDQGSSEIFGVDKRSGFLQMLEAPNREQRESYELKLKAFLKPLSSEREVPVFFYTLYVQDSNQRKIAEDDLTVHVNIMDLNDNAPEFLTFENPVVVSVSSHLESGALIAKMEAWDADKDLNAKLRYSLIHDLGSSTDRLFRIHPITGDVTLLAPLINIPGQTLSVGVEARDLDGAQNGLAAKVDLLIFVIDNGFQLKMVLDNSVENVMIDVSNITETLSSLTGLNVKAYEVDKHDNDHHREATDLLIYAVDEFNKLVSSTDLISSLTKKLPEAKLRLKHHRLREVRAGGHTLSPEASINPGSSTNAPNDDQDSLGSLEIAILAMACAVFFGAFIAVVSILSIRARRQAKNGSSGAYPAPLAIPLPNYSIDPNNNPPNHHIGILHHGEYARQSLKSKFRPSAERSFIKGMDTSEETSDTCVDDHHDVSSGPPSGAVEFHNAAGVTPKSSRRSRSNNHSPTKSPSWRIKNQTLERATRSRDSGINDQRESLSMSCSCNNDTSCGSCSDQSEDHHHVHHHQDTMSRSNPHRHSTTSSQFRRHKSASPSRRRKSTPHQHCSHCHHGHGHATTLHRHHGHHQNTITSTIRSKSAGQLIDDDHHIRESTRSRSRSKSKVDCPDCCSVEMDPSRSSRDRQSTRSTRWEVYRHIDSPKKSTGSSSQRRKSPIYKAELQGSESPETLRIASSTANKAHSWRGDHPMKAGTYFQSNPPSSYYAHQSKTFNHFNVTSSNKPAYEFGHKTGSNFLQSGGPPSKIVQNGIRLVGLASSPNNNSIMK